MPVTPITDIKVVRGDLAISTMGRSFWVLDNITTLRQDAFRAQGERGGCCSSHRTTIRYRQTFQQSRPGCRCRNIPTAGGHVIDYYPAD